MDTLSVPFVSLVALCDRAVRHRCTLASEAGASEADLRRIRSGVPFRDLRIESHGWVLISLVVDGFAGVDYHLYWCPGSDRLRLHRLAGYEEGLPGDPPLRRRRLGTSELLRDLPFIADPFIVYTCDGVDHDWRAAEFLANERGSIEGWTWRRR